MATTLAALITSCRTIAADGPSDNFARAENVNDAEFGFPIDGVNTTFVVKNLPITPSGTVKVVADNMLLQPTAYIPNESIGEITLAVAPITSCYVSYFFFLFPDSVWTEFVAAAMQVCNFSTGDPTDDVPLVNERFLPPIKAYTHAYFCNRVAAQTGLWYNQRLQERVEDRDNISSKWLRLGQAAEKRADILLAAAYEGSGSEVAPAFRIGGFQPQPWAPYR